MDPKNEIKNKTPGAATFKWHVLIFFIVIMLLWVLWYIGLKAGTQTMEQRNRFPWPVWPMLIWAMALMFHYTAVFRKKN